MAVNLPMVFLKPTTGFQNTLLRCQETTFDRQSLRFVIMGPLKEFKVASGRNKSRFFRHIRVCRILLFQSPSLKKLNFWNRKKAPI